MTSLNHFFRKPAAGLALLILIGSVIHAAAQVDLSRPARVIGLQGKARSSTDGQPWQPLKKGSLLKAGALIQTAENSTLDILLGEGTGAGLAFGEKDAEIVRMSANSLLAIDHLSSEPLGMDTVGNIQLNLRAGEITGRAGKLAAASTFEIKFTAGVAGVRGGAYRLNAAGLAEVVAGEMVVAVISADGSPITKLVSAGQRFDPGTGTVTAVSATSAADLPPAKAPANPSPIHAAPNNSAMKWPGFGSDMRKF